MTKPLPLRFALLPLLGLSALLSGCPGSGRQKDPSTPAPLNPQASNYADSIRAFTVGTLALQVEENERALRELTRATELAPGEPAGWANLGLLQLRGGRYPEAEQALAKAGALAPRNSDILTLRAEAAARQAKTAEQIQFLRQATQADPKNLRAAYTLATAVRDAGGPEADAEFDRLMGDILKAEPDNLVALLEVTRSAARRNDAATARKNVATLAALGKSWPVDVKTQLATLQTQAAGTNLRLVAIEVQRLQNTLQQVPEFRLNKASLQGSQSEVGKPIYDLLAGGTLPRTPAAPDTALTLTVAPAPTVSGGGQVRAFYPASDAKAEIIAGRAAGEAVAALDFNYDFLTDRVFAGNGGLRLEQQAPGSKFTDVTAKAKLPAAVVKGRYTGVWAVDIEADGDLDLVLGVASGPPITLRNNGDGTWKVISPFPKVSGLIAWGWGDLDADGDPDALIADGSATLRVFRNERNGQFTERTDVGDAARGVTAIAVADLAGDDVLDAVVVRKDGTVAILADESHNKSGATWNITEAVKGTPGASGLLIADLDNNGALDLIVRTQSATQVFLGDGKSWASLAIPVALAANDAADLNDDGLLDLVGRGADGKPAIASGKSTKQYHFLALRPRAKETTGDQRINSFGIGGEMLLRAGVLAQKQVITAPRVHFGLGEQRQADFIRIVWPNGAVRSEFDLQGDKTILAEQRLKGSCPFLFTWNGSEMSFVTDCIWRSPLGLRINAQDTAGVAMTEDWVKIRGDQLVPRTDDTGGKPFYDLRVTADLWETHFFDRLALMPIDHPEGTEIWVDERFAFPPPPLAVIVTRPLQPIHRATADTGADMTATVARRDGWHADYFGRGRYQGVTRDHALEIDLGAEAQKALAVALQRKTPVYLIAHGFIHPTDSSINVALGQGKNPPPSGLSLEIPNGKGGWQLAKPGLGFPTGKVKTVVIRLDDAVRGNSRVRLRTNLEIYWDQVTWAQGVPNANVIKTESVALSATLNYRGFTAVKSRDKSSPELPVAYEPVLSRAQRWRDLEGFYTRYGDIKSLLTGTDDRYVIMNAGDEMRFRFAVPPPPRPGFVRDYVLIGDGWVKDGDYNTTFSRTVLPLPTHKNPNYTMPPRGLENDPVYKQHREDWETFHTRYVAPDSFRSPFGPQ